MTALSSDNGARGPGLPDGWGCAPLFPATAAAGVQLCVVVARPEAGGGVGGVGRGGPVLVHDLFDARVLLGCVVDASYQPISWVEVEVQDTRSLLSAPATPRESMCNRSLDDRFRLRHGSSGGGAGGAGRVLLGCEGLHTPPTWIDPDTLDLVTVPSEGGPWVLCEDDAALQAAGLDAYSTTLSRYLHRPDAPDGAFIPLDDAAARGERTRELADVFGGSGIDHGRLLPLNPTAGLIACRFYAPAPLLEFAAALGGRAWDQAMHGRPSIRAVASARAMSQASDRTVTSDGRIFAGRMGRTGRMAEALYLKLRLIAQMFDATIARCEGTRLPVLNLTDESYRVRMPDAIDPGLPVLWTGSPMLTESGVAARVDLPGSDASIITTVTSLTPSLYRPEQVTRGVAGRGTVLIRSVESEKDRMVVTATLKTDDSSSVRADDWVWLRPTVGDGRIPLVGTVDPDSALASGEVRFRTEAQQASAESVDLLKRVAGVQLNDVPFQTSPKIGPACDLYSLAVLSLRVLMTAAPGGSGTRMEAPAAELVDEALSLARAVASSDTGKPLEARIAGVFRSDERWLQRLGPDRLVDEGLSPAEAMELIPPALWMRVLAWVLRLAPGATPEAYAHHLGDGASMPPASVLRRPRPDLDRLLAQSHTLLFGDWHANREVRSVLHGLRSSTGG